ncbi:MAG: deoxyribose-phosphate aldolase [Alistipes sp.]|nr:deoxyribose-phosphate aldolase [Alistipes sp.]
MEYSNHLQKFGSAPTAEQVESLLQQIRPQVSAHLNETVWRRCFGSLDLTTLRSTDSHESVASFASRAAALREHFPQMPNVASVCVYPIFVETVGVALDDSGLAITSVAGGFPSSQTYLEVKMLEASMAVENGADEIDVVLNLGEMLDGEYDLMGNEIEMLRNEIGEEVTLKVILESGILAKPELIWRASLIAMMAGADFIKTSTGKERVAATPQAAVVMCQAIAAFAAQTGRKVGFKAAGGITTPEDASLYYTIVAQILGEEWLVPDRFRLGASSLANALLGAIEHHPVAYF